MRLSSEPVMRVLESWVNARARTGALWPESVCISFPVGTSKTLMIPVSWPVAIVRPLGDYRNDIG